MLLFQAIVTFIIGIVLISQVLNLDSMGVSELVHNIGTVENPGDFYDASYNIKSRFEIGSYILVVVALIEVIIITRLVG